jgi:tetratricopeptide (TPR) repeat protein
MARLLPFLDTPGWEEHLSFLLLVASVRLEVGDLDGAEAAITRAVGDSTRQRLPIGLVDALRVQGAIAARRGVREEAKTCLRRAAQLAREITYPWGEARALYELGLLRAHLGQPDGALEQLAAASAIFGRLGAEPYRARADRAIEALGRGAILPPSPR